MNAFAEPEGPRRTRTVALEPARHRVRVRAGGLWVGDSHRAVLLFERGITPRWYLPFGDIRADRLRANGRITPTAGRGIARWYDLATDDAVIVDAAWDHPAPPPGCPALDGLVSFEWDLMDAWFEEDDEAFVHPRDPYTRVDVLASSRHVVVEVDDVVLADTTRSMMLLETALPTRYYIHPLDVQTDLLVPSATVTWCPYKGRASYWHAQIRDTLHRDLFWGYSSPLPAAQRVVNHLCAFNEFCDITVDGVRVDRPETKWATGGPTATVLHADGARWDPTSAPPPGAIVE